MHLLLNPSLLFKPQYLHLQQHRTTHHPNTTHLRPYALTPNHNHLQQHHLQHRRTDAASIRNITASITITINAAASNRNTIAIITAAINAPPLRPLNLS
jgi:hypothetical protein